MPNLRTRQIKLRAATLAVLTALLGFGLGCTTNEGDTIVVDGLDCGLIRNDLIGNWVVSFLDGVRTVVNCDDPSYDNIAVDVTAGSITYANVSVFASPSSTSFLVSSYGPNNLPDELIASVEADSCLALVQIWENDDAAWMQCIGTLDRANGTIGAVCDSADLDTSGGVVACDLNSSLYVDILIP